MITLITLDWLFFRRNLSLALTLLLFALSLALIAGLNASWTAQQRQAQGQAHAHIRQQWDEMGPANPHGAAHFGTYAFRPVSLLSSLDEGVQDVVGNVLRLEGHTQNELVFSTASQATVVSRFGKLSPALLYQFFVPLVLIFLAFQLVQAEKDKGRLRLVLCAGISPRKWLLSKTLSVWLLSALLLFCAIAVQALALKTLLQADAISRLVVMLAAYLLYYFILISWTVFLASRWKNTGMSLTFMVSVWMLWSVFLPEVFGNWVEQRHPLPSRALFNQALQEDRAKGVDGHNPADQREQALQDSVLAAYGVDSLSQLPINYDGLLMQADEEYGNKVWDRHFGKNDEILNQQKQSLQHLAAVNPFLAVQSLSMAAAGTDLHHHLDFLQQAESYRRFLIKALNDEHAFGGSGTGEWDWQADGAFFSSLRDFSYETPAFELAVPRYAMDGFVLLAWSLFSAAVLFFFPINLT